MIKNPATAEQVALLYGVAKSTVYRWYENDAFDVPPLSMPSPSGTRDRLIFDRETVAKQYEKEVLDPRSKMPTDLRNERKQKLEAFRAG